MTQWEVYIYIKGFGADCYRVNAEDEAEAKAKAVQRVLCETDYTTEDFVITGVLQMHR